MEDCERKAIERLKMASDLSLHYYKQPLTIGYSGGKDSEVLVDLAIISKIPCVIQHSHTTIDSPLTVRHVRSKFKEWELQGHKLKIDYPKKSFWRMLGEKTTPPTRLVRWCCEEQKEFANKNKVLATGIRWSESNRRAKNRGIIESNAPKKEQRIILTNDNDDKRMLIDKCMTLNLTTVNPIIDWSDEERDGYIEQQKITCNPQYCLGFKRCGCVGCCLSSRKQKEYAFEVFPKYKALYIKGFQRMLELRNHREKQGLADYKMKFQTAQDIFYFYMEKDVLFGQTSLFD